MMNPRQLDSTDAAGAAAGAVLQAITPDAFMYLFFVLLASNVVDWVWGRWAARQRCAFDSRKSRYGALGKLGQLALLLLVRSLEAALPELTSLPEVVGAGFGSSAFALMLILDDWQSIERHVASILGRPVPGFSRIMHILRVVTGGDRRVDPSRPQPIPPPPSTPRQKHDGPPPEKEEGRGAA